MKMKNIIILLLILFSTNVFSQNENTPDEILPHHFKTKSINLLYLNTADGNGAKVSFARVSNSLKISTFSMGLDWGEFKAKTDYTNIFADYVHFYKLINIKNKYFINIGPGAYVAYEMQKNTILDSKHNSLGLGLSGDAEMEIYIKRFAILGGFKQIYKPVSDIGTWQYHLNVGLRYIFR